MNELKELFGKQLSERAIEELTLIKTALQEKNEALRERESRIRQLMHTVNELENEIREMEDDCAACRERAGSGISDERLSGGESLLEELIHLISRYEINSCHGEGYGSIPGDTLVHLLERTCGLEIIEGPVEEIDPRFHRVVEVRSDEDEQEQIVQLSKGYRIGERVILPVTLRVIRGGDENNREERRKPRLVLYENLSPGVSEPEGAA